MKKQEQMNELLHTCEELVEYAEPIFGLGDEIAEYVVPMEEFVAMQKALTAVGRNGEGI